MTHSTIFYILWSIFWIKVNQNVKLPNEKLIFKALLLFEPNPWVIGLILMRPQPWPSFIPIQDKHFFSLAQPVFFFIADAQSWNSVWVLQINRFIMRYFCLIENIINAINLSQLASVFYLRFQNIVTVILLMNLVLSQNTQFIAQMFPAVNIFF